MIEAILTGLACGLVTWGGIKVELRYLRRDVDRAHKRIDHIEKRVIFGERV